VLEVDPSAASRPELVRVWDAVCAELRSELPEVTFKIWIDPLAPAALVDRLIDLAGPLEVSEDTRAALLALAEMSGGVSFATEADREEAATRVAQLLTLVVAAPEYQLA
jgi:hypothetical protein